jgi:catecholate siderophore receptor
MPPLPPLTAMLAAVRAPRAARRFTGLSGLCLAWSAMTTAAAAQTATGATGGTRGAPPTPAQTPEHVNVVAPPAKPRGLAKLPDKLHATPETIDVVSQAAMKQQSVTSLQDALRYAPGITLNSGEGGAHGDNINLRGFSSIDSLFLDGIRDPGSFTRDSFDYQSLEVLQGPASVLFGNGSAGGLVNQTSKQPSLATRRDFDVETGTNDEARATIDVDQPIGPNAAIRVNLMGDTSGVADRDYVQQRRWGAAPSLTLGLNTPTVFTLSYFHQEEKDIPDYGIPFLFGEPAPVNRSNYYGLKNYDITETNVNIATATLKHDFNSDLSVTNILRYASYWADYRVSAPHFGDDFTGGAPAPGTPLDDILIYRDRPSSEGVQTYFTDHTDITGRFDTGSFANTAIGGIELGRQTTDYRRFNNDYQGVDGVAPTSLVSPNAEESAPAQDSVVARPDTGVNMFGIYATDEIRLAPMVKLDLGIRYDLYDTHFHDVLADAGFRREDSAWSPKVAVVVQPNDAQTYYVSYTTSFDPAVSYLTLAPDSKGPAPETAKTIEVGTKLRWLSGMMTSTATAFRIDAANITISDPDDPTLQEIPGSNQRVQGVELTTTGYLTSTFEINANYTFIDPEISKSSIPAEIGKQIPEAARNVANVWATYEPNDNWRFAAGVNYVGHRYADTLNTANIPGYVVLNAMIADQLTEGVHLQLNVQNITDAHYFTGAYFSDPTENHVLPGQGRVFTLNTDFSF